ncbi:MAG TPA: NmrA family transcriptional regulator [Xanthobacteraceae bacterium]|nr:NmrA family transcriptional regulator [Xanthobacteraceae bacterium]
MRIVVIGGIGLIGSKVVEKLKQKRHEGIAAAPNTGVNTITGEGLKEAMAGAQVVNDLANSPPLEDKAALEFFETSGRNLLPAEVADVALAAPRNGIVEIAGPERAPFNEIVARYLKAVGDNRVVVSDPEARYFGGRIEKRSLVPLGEARPGRIAFDGSATHWQQPDSAPP